MERWKPIAEWPLYEVSDRGNIRSWAAHPKSKLSRRPEPVIKKHSIIKCGYALVTFVKTKNGERKIQAFYVHRLVARYFVPGYAKGLDVAHLDGSKTNNVYTNLLWCSRATNMSHAISHGTKTEGEKHKSTKLCDKGVAAVLKLKEIGFNAIDIAFIFGISPSTVCDYAAGRSRFSVVKRRSRRTHLTMKVEAPVIKRQL